MDKWGEIATWSIDTGNLMYKFQSPNFSENDFENFSPYAADKDDNSYHHKRMNFNDKTIQLIKCNDPNGKLTSKLPPSDQVTMPPMMWPVKKESTRVNQKEKPCNMYKFYVIEMFNHKECSAEKDTP